MSKQDDPSERKKKLEALLMAIASGQDSRKAPAASQSSQPKPSSSTPNKLENKKLVDALFASYTPKPVEDFKEADVPVFIHAAEPVGQESWAKRQRYLYPPIIPEDIAASINYGVAKGILDPLNDPVAVELMNPGELRKTIQAGRLDPSDLPLLKYRIDKLLGLTKSTNAPSGQEMLSAQAYYYRGDVKMLDNLRKGVLDDLQEDYQTGSMTQEEYQRYRDEALKIIDQYLSSK